jgi:hypothetical protein
MVFDPSFPGLAIASSDVPKLLIIKSPAPAMAAKLKAKTTFFIV